MKIKLDSRHSKAGSSLFCKVSSTDIKKDNTVTVSVDAILANIDVINKIIFEFDANALEWVAQDLQIEPEADLVFPLEESVLQSLKTVQDMVGTSYYLIPIFRISGFVECYIEKPQQRSLFDDD